MSVFQALVEGNGTKPLRLALSPSEILEQAEPAVGAAMVTDKLTEADCAVGRVESVTVAVTGEVPSALTAGVPVIAPVVWLMDRPLGRPLAL